MKRSYLIVAGGIVLTTLVGFWVYSFLYGDPSNNKDLFTNLNIFGQNPPSEIIPEPIIDPTPAAEVDTAKLRQLSTKSVVGMLSLNNASNTIRYVEGGTGHVYDIDTRTKVESRISQISIPQASEAIISPNGDYVAVRSGTGNQNEVILLDLTTITNPSQEILPYSIESFAFAFNNELLFTEIVGSNTEGKGYLPSTKVVRRLFSIPFIAATVAWSKDANTPHYIYTKPTQKLLSYVYEIRDTKTVRLPLSGYGLTLTPLTDGVLLGRVNERNQYYTTHYRKSTDIETNLPISTIANKCVAVDDPQIFAYCGGSLEPEIPIQYPDNWYKGIYSGSDRLIAINPSGITQIANPEGLVGQPIDVINMKIDTSNSYLYFLNKIDQTLWLYEIKPR